jgi:hypothetical protein
MGVATALTAPGAALAATTGPGGGPWWLLAPMKPGDEVGFGWSLHTLQAYDRGAWTLTLKREAIEARVHICYHNGSPRGVAHGELLDLILMDGGDGGKPTVESLGRVLQHLATVVRENELREGADTELSALMTHHERVVRYGGESLV